MAGPTQAVAAEAQTVPVLPAGEQDWLSGSAKTWVLAPGATEVELREHGTGADPSAILATGGVVWVGFDGLGLIRSDDNGLTWSDAGCPSNRVQSLASEPGSGDLLVGTADLGVLRYAP